MLKAGLLIWGVAAAAALRGQSLANPQAPELARPWLLAAAALGLVGLVLIDDAVPATAPAAPTVCLEPWRCARHRRLSGAGLVALGALCSLGATLMVVWHAPEASATWLWVFGLGAVVAGVILASRRPLRPRWPRLTRTQNSAALIELLLLAAILGVALWLRLPNLASIPPEVHGDEAAIGIDARKVLAGQLPVVFGTGWYDIPALSFSIQALGLLAFGNDLVGLRMASAIEGVLSVLALYVLARRVWGPRPALIAAALMAVAAWHIHFSRSGIDYMQALLATLLALYFLIRGLQERRALDFVLCGFALGVCAEVYYAARLTPVIMASYLGYRAVTERTFLRTHALGLAAVALGAIVFMAPMLAILGRHPTSFSSRTADVLVTSPRNLEHELGAYHVATAQEVLGIQVLRTLEAFNIRGETSLQYGHPAPLLDLWTGALLAMGAVGILIRVGSASSVLLAAWVWLTLLFGSVLTVDALFSPRVLIVLPALVLVPALVMESAWRGVTAVAGRVGAYAFGLPVIGLLLLALQANVHDYFDVQVVQRQPAGRATLLAEQAKALQDRYRVYPIGREDFTLSYETARFLVPNPDAVDVRNAPLALPLDHIPTDDKGAAFILETSAPDFTQRLDSIRRAYPDGRLESVTQPNGNPVLAIYLVDHAALAAANPRATTD